MENTIKKQSLIESKYKQLLFVGFFGWGLSLIGQVMDNILSGNVIGTAGLSGVQLVAPFVAFIMFISSIISFGCGTRYFNLAGEGDNEHAYRNAGSGLVYSILIGVVFATIMYSIKDIVISSFNTSEEICKYADQYYRWYMLVVLFQPTYNLLLKLATNDGDSFWPLVSSITQVGINLIASNILVRTSLEVAGLGLGTNIGLITSTFVILIHYFSKKNSIKFKLNFDLNELKDNFKLGLGPSIGGLFDVVFSVILNAVILSQFGEEYLASFAVISVVFNFNSFFVCVPDSMSSFISSANGARNNDDISYCINLEKKYSIIVTLIISLLVCLLSPVIPKAFGLTPELAGMQYTYSKIGILLIAISYFAYPFLSIIKLTYNAMQQPLYGIITEIVSCLICPILFPIILGKISYYGFIAGFAVSAIVSMIAMVVITKTCNKRTHKVFEMPAIDEEQFSADFMLNDKEIEDFFANTKTKLSSLGVNELDINNITGCLSDLFKMVRIKNSNKDILNRTTICVSNNGIRFINKNNAQIPSEQELEQEKQKIDLHPNLSAFDNAGTFSVSSMITFNYATMSFERNL